MNKPNFINDLNCLLVRFSHLGIGADIATMSLIELWGIYSYLNRLAES